MSSKIQNPKPCTGVRGVSPGRDSFAYSGLGRGCSSYLTRSCSAERASAACASADRHAAKCAKGKFDGSPAYCLLSWSSANSPSPVCAYSPSPVWVCGSMQCTRYTSTRAHGHAVAAQCTMRAWSTDTHAGRPSGRPAGSRPQANRQAGLPPSLPLPPLYAGTQTQAAYAHARKQLQFVSQSIRVHRHTSL